MTYTNSSLVTYTKLSPNCNVRQNSVYNPSGAITKITLHHAACNASLAALGNGFANPAREASSNYGIDSNGNIGMFVEEKNRAWTSGSAANDHLAITVEIANDGGAPDWHISDRALAAAIKLCVDVCKRNGIKQLDFTGDTTGNMTMHCWFQATTCPGPYLKSKFMYIANEVNKQLNAQPQPTPSLPGYTGIITYSAFAGGKWWADISSANVNKGGTNSYAGCFGIPLTAIRAKPEYGKIWMSVHYLNGGWSKKVDVTRTGYYVGTNTKKIDGVKMWSETGHIDFRVHDITGRWWSWIDSRNCDGKDYNSYAGLLGTPIDAIQMY